MPFSWTDALFLRSLRRRRHTRTNPNGFVLWEGNSEYSGEPIVVIVTFQSLNRKTGDILQTWILRADLTPQEARNQDRESPVCGSCPLQGPRGGCYVNTGRTAGSVYESFLAGNYPRRSPAMIARCHGRKLRIGAYGDPGATPISAWKPILSVVSSTVGYTHSRKPEWQPYCMASVETIAQAADMQSKGWRTFRARRPGTGSLTTTEIVCPATRKRNPLTCSQCRLCDGAGDGSNIVIDAHGRNAIHMLHLLD